VTRVAVREARPDELAAAGRLVADAYAAHGGPDGDDHGYLAVVRDAPARAQVCPVLVAVEEGTGTLLGCVTYVPGPGNPFAELEQDGEAGFRMLGVALAAQRRGVGEALVRACIGRARDAGRRGLAICTAPDMVAAQRLYERLGFVRAPTRDFDPVPGVNLLAYTLAL
jgi:ribosomal protein S18 acetylase RimI-like enzyme